MRRKFFLCDGLGNIPAELRGAAIAIGNFDGLHRGHQQVFAQLKCIATAQNVPAVALTFEPHPRTYFAKGAPVLRLTDIAAKARVAKAIGFDGMIVLNFDQALSEIEPVDFVQRLLIDRINCSAIVVGDNFRFGRKRMGDVAVLQRMGETSGFSVTAAELLSEDGAPVSSTRIRAALTVGNLAEANCLLGYSWFTPVKISPSGTTAINRLSLHTNGIARLLNGHFAVRGNVGPWPIEGLAETRSDSSGELQITWADHVPTGPRVRATLAFLTRLENRPSEQWSHRSNSLDRAIGLA